MPPLSGAQPLSSTDSSAPPTRSPPTLRDRAWSLSQCLSRVLQPPHINCRIRTFGFRSRGVHRRLPCRSFDRTLATVYTAASWWVSCTGRHQPAAATSALCHSVEWQRRGGHYANCRWRSTEQEIEGAASLSRLANWALDRGLDRGRLYVYILCDTSLPVFVGGAATNLAGC
jgi:hypothetical protein